MDGFRKSIFYPLMLIVAGVAAFFLYLFLIGHDPDERTLALSQWMTGGMFIGPGFGCLSRWRGLKDSRKAKVD